MMIMMMMMTILMMIMWMIASSVFPGAGSATLPLLTPLKPGEKIEAVEVRVNLQPIIGDGRGTRGGEEEEELEGADNSQ